MPRFLVEHYQSFEKVWINNGKLLQYSTRRLRLLMESTVRGSCDAGTKVDQLRIIFRDKDTPLVAYFISMRCDATKYFLTSDTAAAPSFLHSPPEAKGASGPTVAFEPDKFLFDQTEGLDDPVMAVWSSWKTNKYLLKHEVSLESRDPDARAYVDALGVALEKLLNQAHGDYRKILENVSNIRLGVLDFFVVPEARSAASPADKSMTVRLFLNEMQTSGWARDAVSPSWARELSAALTAAGQKNLANEARWLVHAWIRGEYTESRMSNFLLRLLSDILALTLNSSSVKSKRILIAAAIYWQKILAALGIDIVPFWVNWVRTGGWRMAEQYMAEKSFLAQAAG